jgi:hypothetical protein
VGAISELLVCADLLKKGYEVFRAVSQHCSCDLAILKDKALVRVEVRTAFMNGKGELNYAKPKPEKSDVLALVLKDGNIFYRPELGIAIVSRSSDE